MYTVSNLYQTEAQPGNKQIAFVYTDQTIKVFNKN